jgi:hypothetical protein
MTETVDRFESTVTETLSALCESKRSSNNVITTKIKIQKDTKKRLRDEHIEDASTGTIIDIKESKRNYSIDIIAPYIDDTLIDKYYRLQCIHDKTIPATIFGRSNPTKEITESMAAHKAVFDFITHEIKDITFTNRSDVLCICVADGVSPKTGSIFAISTKWNVVSIDPEMNEKWLDTEKCLYPNLKCYRSLIEDYEIDFEKYNYFIVIGVHSHANMNDLWMRFTGKMVFMVSIPCCGGFVHIVDGVVPYLDGFDTGIHSIKNRVICYKTIPLPFVPK